MCHNIISNMNGHQSSSHFQSKDSSCKKQEMQFSCAKIFFIYSMMVSESHLQASIPTLNWRHQVEEDQSILNRFRASDDPTNRISNGILRGKNIFMHMRGKPHASNAHLHLGDRFAVIRPLRTSSAAPFRWSL